jgi:RHS repeat-associated protein
VRTVTWDAASRVTGYTHVNGSNLAQPTFAQTFGYDDLNRLTTWTAASTSQAFQYDLTGNRTRLTIGATNHAYTVASTSNRLTATAGPAPAQTNTYDAAGNLTSNGSVTFTYSDRGRMSRATVGANQVNYLYNGLGQRVSKQGPTALVPTGTHLYTFDEAGHLIGEYDFTATPRVRQETVYLGDTPVAVLTQTVAGSPAVFTTAVNYVYTDHIDTPRVITQASDNRMRWRWDQADPFGTSAPNQNPASIGAFTYNPRFPGQFYDVESNLHYNYFRDYDPRIGRYTQSDPIGLAGGINTYGYVGGNPVNYVDPTGEVAVA